MLAIKALEMRTSTELKNLFRDMNKQLRTLAEISIGRHRKCEPLNVELLDNDDIYLGLC